MSSNHHQNILTDLHQLAASESRLLLSELMAGEGRDQLVFSLDDLSVDLTRQPVTPASLSALLQLADSAGLRQNIDDMMAGRPVNLTENRPAIHCQLRSPEYRKTEAFTALCAFVDQLRGQGQIKHVVNIGIGGSDLGPAMVYRALTAYQSGPAVHFVGNIDPSDLNDVLALCQPETTLFIITSKTFTTAETMANAALARHWLQAAGCSVSDHMAGVTAAPERARDWGLDAGRIFAFAEGVGGRYSLWSSVGLAVMLGVGTDPFRQLLDGAHAMDNHFATADFAHNIPVLLGLLRVWHRSFLGRPSYGLMPYDQRLGRLPAWAQQLEMESNGKSVDRQGGPLALGSGPLIWGEPGTNGQHSFFQWLHQGTDIVPVDILVPRRPSGLDQLASSDQLEAARASHRTLAINAVAQAEALALGAANTDQPHRHFAGNRPSVLISWDQTTPYALGRLLALYEHITVVSGFIWGLNSFDQWGVELGKQMASQLSQDSSGDGFSRAARAFLATVDEQG
ncbi:MAG: glucose-6-phosphate isomerase [Candidatus Puniceispirillaceae bacterium]